MPRIIPLLPVLMLVASLVQPARAQGAFDYRVDLTNPDDDLFHVRLQTPALGPADSLYSFTAFAPGVHQVLDFGRFVTAFQALDATGAEIPTARRATNDWFISDPTRVAEIRYAMEDSFDAEVESHVVYPMSGTGIEPGYAAINTHGLFGYFVHHRAAPTTVALRYPDGWTVGTALGTDTAGRYVADSYYHLADSPILVGNLSTATRQLGDIRVEAYVFSPDPAITADTVLALADDILQAAYAFVGYAPVDRYAFLMYFNDEEARARNPSFAAAGALEHSYSSTYALPAQPEMLPILADVVAHEFMHILTPLHLRSEVIAEWDYSRPTGEDQHLWLYEGVTEWMAHIMQLRGGLTDVDEFLDTMSGKIRASEQFESDWSLTRLSAEWFTEEGRGLYGDIYQLGPLTAMCLDLRLLDLSDGERGLRDVLLDLMEQYGTDRPFDNATFFDEFGAATYPEVEAFIEAHIRQRQPLDFGACLAPVGIRYTARQPAADPTPRLGLRLQPTPEGRLAIGGFSRNHEPFGLREGDVILELFGEEVTMESSRQVLGHLAEMQGGDPYTIRVARDGEELELTGRLATPYDYHVLAVDPDATAEQRRLRQIWQTNRAE